MIFMFVYRHKVLVIYEIKYKQSHKQVDYTCHVSMSKQFALNLDKLKAFKNSCQTVLDSFLQCQTININYMIILVRFYENCQIINVSDRVDQCQTVSQPNELVECYKTLIFSPHQECFQLTGHMASMKYSHLLTAYTTLLLNAMKYICFMQ